MTATHFFLMIMTLCGGPFVPRAQATPDESVIEQWRVAFPDVSFVCWQKSSPWAGLDRLQAPPAGVSMCSAIDIEMGRNEYESTSFVLTNLSDAAMTFQIDCETTGVTATLRRAVWVKADGGSQVNDALSLIDDGRIDLPSGESVEIWLTLHGHDAPAGRYTQTVNILPRGLEPRAVQINVRVRDVLLPKQLPLAVSYFDEIVGAWSNVTDELVQAYMKDMKSHYVNHGYVHPDPVPRMAVDADGRLVSDYAPLDRLLDDYKTLDPEGLLFFWASKAFLEPTGNWSASHPESIGRPKFMTPQWKQLFREWLTGWVAHMKKRGIGYDGFIMHPYDERGGSNVQAMIKQIKAVDPRIRVAFNGAMGRTTDEIENNIAPYIDVWIPNLYHYLDTGGVNGNMSQVVAVKAKTKYTLSFYGKNGSASIYYDLIFDGSTSRHAQSLDAARWRQESFEFTTAADTSQVNIRFFPTVGDRTILIDDVVLRCGDGPNLVKNGDMEQGASPTHWSTSSATFKINTRDPHGGRQCAEINNIPLPPTPGKLAAKRMLGPASGKSVWTYANPVGIGPLRASPYADYRLPVWRAWREGMTGFSTWKYSAAHWDATDKGPNWNMVYRSDLPDCPPQVSKRELVLPGKRWEASREGVEDYVFLWMLREAIENANGDTAAAKKLLAQSPDTVLGDTENAALADRAKKDILQAIVELTAMAN